MITGRELREKYIRNQPTTFCPGCGDGMLLNGLSRAVEGSGIPREKIVAVSGIGCAAWVASPYWRVDTFHTTHGRAIPHAMGVKLGNRELNVMVVSGDGDCIGIGGNHLIHACRGNIDITVIMVNNGLYAMTGGQVGPTTEFGRPTVTTPYGNPFQGIDATKVAIAAGASHVARWTTYHMKELTRELEHALCKKGLSFIEVLSPCPVRAGKAEKMSGADMLEWYRDNTSKEPSEGKITVGRFLDIQGPELTDEIYRHITHAGGTPR